MKRSIEKPVSELPKVYIRVPFMYDIEGVSESTGLKCEDASLTVQADAEEADINVLVKRFGLTGTMPVLERVPLNADFVGNISYQDALNALRAADEAFMELPAEVRQRFNHDAGAFVDFVSDEKNREEVRKMGFLSEEAEARLSAGTVTTREGTVQAPAERPVAGDTGGDKPSTP